MTFAEHVVDRALRAAAALVDPAPAVSLTREQAEAAVRSERYLRQRGEPLDLFAPLSRFWRTRDGWVRTHGNYPWHRDALLTALGIDDDGMVEARIASLDAAEVEQRAYAAGALAVRLRGRSEWQAETGQVAPALVDARTLDDAPARPPRVKPQPPAPLAGVRVLDLTRVIAGPTATRFLGALGADVLRIDDPAHPELDGHRLDGLVGKRSALMSLPSDTLTALLRDADVVVTGYRPGALDRFGLAPEHLGDACPGLVVVTLSAWGDARGWEGRRGFDSLVQVASGIAAEVGRGDEPGTLPYQALDHGTGYLIAAAVCELLRQQRADGGTRHAALALAHTAAHLLDHWLPLVDDAPAAPATEHHGDTRLVPPPGALDGAGLRWAGPPADYGGAAPAWL